MNVLSKLCLLLLLVSCSQKSPTSINKETGYKVFADKPNFSILIDQNYPTNQSISVMLKKEDCLTLDYSESSQRKASISTPLRGGITISVLLDNNNTPYEIDYLSMDANNKPPQLLKDINMDGFADIKYALGKKYIFMRNKWVEVEKISQQKENFIATIGTNNIFFDKSIGSWNDNGLAKPEDGGSSTQGTP